MFRSGASSRTPTGCCERRRGRAPVPLQPALCTRRRLSSMIVSLVRRVRAATAWCTLSPRWPDELARTSTHSVHQFDEAAKCTSRRRSAALRYRLNRGSTVSAPPLVHARMCRRPTRRRCSASMKPSGVTRGGKRSRIPCVGASREERSRGTQRMHLAKDGARRRERTAAPTVPRSRCAGIESAKEQSGYGIERHLESWRREKSQKRKRNERIAMLEGPTRISSTRVVAAPTSAPTTTAGASTASVLEPSLQTRTRPAPRRTPLRRRAGARALCSPNSPRAAPGALRARACRPSLPPFPAALPCSPSSCRASKARAREARRGRV